MSLITTDTERPLARNQKLMYSIFWLVMLVLLSYPLAWFLVWFWVLFLPFENVFDPIRQMNELLRTFITWPRMIGKAIIRSQEDFPNPMLQSPSDTGGADNSQRPLDGLVVSEWNFTVYSIVWLVMLVLLSWPLAWFLVWFWVLLMPLECIFEPVCQMNLLLEKVITWPRMVGKAIWKGEEEFPNPLQQSSSEALLHPVGGYGSTREEDVHPKTTYTLC